MDTTIYVLIVLVSILTVMLMTGKLDLLRVPFLVACAASPFVLFIYLLIQTKIIR